MKIMKYKLLFITLLVCGIGWAQVNITPIHTGTIASFPNWTHTSCTTAAASSNDYVKMVNASSKLITPLLDFTIYSSKKLNFKAGSFGTVTDAKKTVTISISINNGTSWIVLGTRIPSSSSISAVAEFDIESYSSNQVLIKIETLGADGSNGLRIDDVSITGNSLPTSTTYTTSWSNSAPTTTIDAIIDGNLTTSTDLTCKDLTINSGNTLTIGAGKKLTIAGNLINNGTIVFKSDASGTAMFDVFNGTQSGTGVVTAERYIPARRAFRFVSSPVTTTTTIKQNWQENAGTTAGLGTHITGTGGATNGFDVTGTNNPSMYTFANGSWAAVTNTNVNVLTAGTPYRLMVRGDRTTDLTTNTPTATATTLRSTGAMQTGNLTVNLSSTANDVNFVANPYQAPIYAGVIFGSGSNYTNVNPLDFYIWDPALGSRGAYSTVSISNGQATAGSSHTNLIYPWEAFFVRTSTNGAASITFKEAYKTEPNLGSARTLAVDNRFLKLNLKGLQTNGTWNYVDGIRFDFASQFSNEVNTEDAQKLFNLDEDLAIQKDNAALFSVERRLLPETQETVSLYVSKYRTTSYVFENQAQNITGVQAFLKDNFTNTMHELNGTAYPFTVDTAVPASTHANRFDIVFIPSALATPSETAAITLYPNPTKRGEGFYLQGINKAQVTVYNVLGQNIPVQVKSQGNALQVTPTQTLSQGIYLITVTTEGKTQQVKWIVE
ncbi:MAG: hypothetical protein RL259_308 [Bacteroidota bacterium]